MPAVPWLRPASPGRRPPAAASVGVDALDHAGQHLAGAAFDDRASMPRACERLHALRPSAPGRRPARTSASRMRSGSVSTATSMLLTTGMRGARESRRRQALAQPLGGRLHQARMERRRHRQRQRALGAAAPSAPRRPCSTRGLAAGDHGLRRVVEVDRLDRPRRWPARGLGAALASLPRRPGRGSRPWRRCRPAPPPASPARGSAPAAAASRQRQRAGGDQRGVLAQRVAGHAPPARRRLRRARRGRRRRRRPASPAGCWWSASSASFGPSRISAADVLAERVATLPASVCAHGRVVAPGVEHADGLRALARERRMRTVSCLRLRCACTAPAAPRSVVEQHRAPGEAAADAFEHHACRPA